MSAQSEDLKDQRSFNERIITKLIWFSAVIFIVFILFLIYVLYIGKDQIAVEIIRVVIFLFSGGLGGYAIGSRKKASIKEEIED